MAVSVAAAVSVAVAAAVADAGAVAIVAVVCARLQLSYRFLLCRVSIVYTDGTHRHADTRVKVQITARQTHGRLLKDKRAVSKHRGCKTKV